jgi:uncharacterized membrane protein
MTRSFLPVLVATLALAGLVHLATVILVPRLAPVDSWTRLAALAPGAGFHLVPAGAAGVTPIPGTDPATRLALCRFDLDEDGAIAITGRIDLPYWSLAVHDRTGAATYTLAHRVFGLQDIRIRIVTPDERERIRNEQPQLAEEILLVPVADPKGFVLVRALVATPTAMARVERELGRIDCAAFESE